jgi:WD40 repeat protein
MCKQSILWVTLVLVVRASAYTTGEPAPTSYEPTIQKIVNNAKGLALNCLPQYFENLNIPINSLLPEIQKTFIRAIRNTYYQQLDDLFVTSFDYTLFDPYVNRGESNYESKRSIKISNDKYRIISVYENTTNQLKWVLYHYGFVSSLALSSDSKYIISTTDNNTAKIWNGETGELITTIDGLEPHGCPSILTRIDADNKYFTTIFYGGEAKTWDMRYFTNTITLSELFAHIKQ